MRDFNHYHYDNGVHYQKCVGCRLQGSAEELLEACEAILTLLKQGQQPTLEHDGAYLQKLIDGIHSYQPN